MTTTPKNCLCGSRLPYDACCALLHTGANRADTAEALMRSRFTAYAMHNAAYLLQSWDTGTRPDQIDFSKENSEWTRLDIISCKKGQAKDTKGIVEFKAYFTQDGKEQVLNEVSRFVKKQGQWLYLDGKVKSIGACSGPVNQGLNAPCTCGSGKKFKRCCGK